MRQSQPDHRCLSCSAALLLAVGLMQQACGPTSDLRFSGQTGQLVAMTLNRDVPAVSLGLGSRQGQALVDSGSPLTFVAPSTDAPSVPSPQATTFGLNFQPLPAIAAPIGVFETNDPCQNQPTIGLLGADLISEFRLWLDYRGLRASLLSTDQPAPSAADTDPPIQVQARLAGGGLVSIPPNGANQRVGATRLLLPCTVDGQPCAALVDTGASLTVISRRLLAASKDSARPSACCLAIATGEAVQQAMLYRLRSLALGDGETIAVDNAVAVSLADDALFDDLSSEVGDQVDLIVGGSLLRRFAVEVDYRRRRLSFAAYRQHDHLNQSDFILPGFSFCRLADRSGALVLDVFEGSDAQRQGLRSADVVLEINDTPIAGRDTAAIHALFRQTALGQRVTLQIRSGMGNETRAVAVSLEQILATY